MGEEEGMGSQPSPCSPCRSQEVVQPRTARQRQPVAEPGASAAPPVLEPALYSQVCMHLPGLTYRQTVLAIGNTVNGVYEWCAWYKLHRKSNA